MSMRKDVEFGTSSLPPAQIPCECGEKILIPLEAILDRRGATCWNCNARLEVDVEQSGPALQALRELTEKIQRIRHDALS